MTPSDILTKAIEKAVKNGWQNTKLHVWFDYDGKIATGLFSRAEKTDLLFDHDFAKAFWGDGAPHNKVIMYGLGQHAQQCLDCKKWNADGILPLPCDAHGGWQHHLQQLALIPPEERLEYLVTFLDK